MYMPEEEYESDYYEGDMYAGMSEDQEDLLGWDELSEGEGVDLEDFRLRAWQRLYQHYVCSLGGSGNPTDALLTEAEMHMTQLDYTQALICALATEGIEGKATMRRQMICTIALYQLGDKQKALELKDAILAEAEEEEFENISEYLGDRFKGTCEVLAMMPDLLSLLRGVSNSQ